MQPMSSAPDAARVPPQIGAFQTFLGGQAGHGSHAAVPVRADSPAERFRAIQSG
jgi:hypothetical protein